MRKFLPKTPKFLKYGAALMASGFYIWAIIILLNNDNWIGISALTTMLLAIAAFWTIRQNYSLRKREQRERLLNEIIEWVDDVAKAAFLRQTRKRHELWSVLLKYRYLYAKSKYINVFVQSDFRNLSQYMSDITCNLKSLMDFTDECTTDKGKREQLKEYEKILECSVERFYEEAAEETAEIKVKYEGNELKEERKMTEIDVGKELVEIKELLKKNEKIAKTRWTYNLGFAGMIASLALYNINIWGAAIVFVIGYLLMVLSPHVRR